MPAGCWFPPARRWATRLAPAPSTAPGARGLCLLPFGVWGQEWGPASKGLQPVGSVVPRGMLQQGCALLPPLCRAVLDWGHEASS